MGWTEAWGWLGQNWRLAVLFWAFGAAISAGLVLSVSAVRKALPD